VASLKIYKSLSPVQFLETANVIQMVLEHPVAMEIAFLFIVIKDLHVFAVGVPEVERCRKYVFIFLIS